MTLSINTPALIFSAISLIMLAYTNRYIALSSLIRNLHDQYLKDHLNQNVIHQIQNLRKRLRLIRRMQALGVLSFISAMVSMVFIYWEYELGANVFFATSLLLFTASLSFSLIEIQISTQALRIQLGDMDKIS